MLPALLTTKERKGGRPSWSRLLLQASTLKVIDCRNNGFPHVLRVTCITLSLWVGPWPSPAAAAFMRHLPQVIQHPPIRVMRILYSLFYSTPCFRQFRRAAIQRKLACYKHRRVHPLTVQPCRAGPKAREKGPKRLPKVINSGAQFCCLGDQF